MTSRPPPDPGEPQGRQLILREAARLFFTAGYSSTSISCIADATGMVKSAIYHHFSSKDNLYRTYAVIRRPVVETHRLNLKRPRRA